MENINIKPSEMRLNEKYFEKDENYSYDKLPKGNLYDFLLERNANHMNDVGIVFAGKEITYEEMHTRIDEYARALYKKGVRKGDIIGLCLANTPEALYLIYAINKLGAIACQINPMDNSFKIMRDLEIVKPKMIFTINESYKNIKKAKKNIEDSIDVIVFPVVQSIDNELIHVLYGLKQVVTGNALLNMNNSLKKLLADATEYDKAEYPKYVPDTLSHIVFTGGSSGTHKGVDLSSNALNSVIRSTDYVKYMKEGDVFLANLPMFMAFGLFTMHYALCNNSRVELTLNLLPKDFIKELDRTKPAGAFGGPIHWDEFIKNPEEAKKLDLSNMVMPVSGGEQLVIEKWEKINEILLKCGAQSKLWNGLGASEMWAPTTIARNDNTVGTIGRAMPFNTVKIVDLNSERELGFNEVGRLYIKGPGMMLGYHANPEETKKVFKYDENGEKWYDSGDIAKIDETGEITFVGREKRCFVCGVDNIYPEQIENIVSDIDGVNSILVTHIFDPNVQNVPIYHIYVDQDIDTNSLSQKIKQRIKNTLGESAMPGEIVYTYEPLPVTQNGKLDPKPLQAEDVKKYIRK